MSMRDVCSLLWVSTALMMSVVVCQADRALPPLPHSFSVWFEVTSVGSGVTQYVAQYYDEFMGRVMVDYAAAYGNTVVTAGNPQPNGTLFEYYEYPKRGTPDGVILHWTQTLVTFSGGNTPPFISCDRNGITHSNSTVEDHTQFPYYRTLDTNAVVASTQNVMIRGIIADSYTVPIDSTMNATWYFAASLTSTPPSSYNRPPLRLEITTNTGNGQQPQLLVNYEFTGFVTGPPLQTVFALPAFGQCIVASAKPFPHTPSTDYSTELEINVNDYASNQYLTIQSMNYYDVSHNRVHVQSHSGAYNDTTQLIFYDSNMFVTVAYDGRTYAGTCLVGVIPDRDSLNLAALPLPVLDLFQLNTPPWANNYWYRGTATSRGVLCDVWYQLSPDPDVTNQRVFAIEWYWAVDQWAENEFQTSDTPVTLVITAYTGVSVQNLRTLRGPGSLANFRPSLIHTFQFIDYHPTTPAQNLFQLQWQIGSLCPATARVPTEPTPLISPLPADGVLSRGAIAGAVIGSLIGGLIIGYIVIRCVWKYSPPAGFVQLQPNMQAPNNAVGDAPQSVQTASIGGGGGTAAAAADEPAPVQMTAIPPVPPAASSAV